MRSADELGWLREHDERKFLLLEEPPHPVMDDHRAHVLREAEHQQPSRLRRIDRQSIDVGIDELRLGPDELKDGLKRDFKQAEDVRISIDWLRLSAAGNVAWSAANVQMSATVNNQRVTLPCRLTNVFEKRDGTWRIMLLHLSMPTTEQEPGQSWPVA